jgi:hypothetical protein
LSVLYSNRLSSGRYAAQSSGKVASFTSGRNGDVCRENLASGERSGKGRATSSKRRIDPEPLRGSMDSRAPLAHQTLYPPAPWVQGRTGLRNTLRSLTRCDTFFSCEHEGTSMMVVNLPLPVGSLPICELPTQRRQAATTQQLVQALEAQAEQTALAGPGQCPAATRGRLTQEFCGDLRASVEDDPGRQRHTHQQTFDVVQVGDLALLPVPAEGLVVTEGGLNGIITNDKFCLSRRGQLKLNWWRRPLRLR